ncbi:MAG TPA: IspD/TarI family cytidylyltransferase [Marmoricola sp.]|nr:IspD/TarI family cytidylyltransferase [Marmoricola sp.]
MPDPRAAVVVLAAGSGSRVGAEVNKVLLPLGGQPVLAHSVRTALEVPGVHRLVVVVRPDDRDAVAAALSPVLGTHDLWLVNGGAQRHDSEYAALRALAPDIEAGDLDVVAMHDAARPLASAGLFRRVIDAAAEHGSAVPALPAGTLSHRDGTGPRSDLARVQTPQAFTAATLLAAYRDADLDGFTGTDTAACLERYAGVTAHSVPGSVANLKVTFPEDLALAERLLARRR